ncbi:MAG: glycosyltransferase family 4 protein [Candidatus Aenigmarchaeota archaeon]|nr:glycosyltransferase family 4 protein [Candidatus Aenigmarchaeota archaeon]
MGKANIFVICPHGIWTKNGGSPTIYMSMKALINKHYDIHLICPYDKTQTNPKWKNLYVHCFKLPKFKCNIKGISWFFNKLKYFIFIILATRKALKISKRYKPSLVYAITYYGAPVGYLISKVKKISNITRLYGTFLFPMLNNKLKLFLHFDEVLAFKFPCKALILTNDGTQGDIVAKRLRVPKNKIKFWINGVDETYISNFNSKKFKKTIGLKENEKMILVLSRLASWKKIDRIIEAMPKIVSKNRKVKLIIVGEGDLEKKLKDLTRKLEMNNYIKFIGMVRHVDTKKYINSADIVVSVNNLSNISNTILESMNAGKCIVTINTGNTKSIIKNYKNGILLEKGNVNKLSNIILKLLKDDKLRKRLGKNARKFAKKNFKTWKQRAGMEANLIEKYIK